MNQVKKMFSENGKISEKQLRRMLMLTTFAGTIFVIPYLGARLFKESIFTGLIVFFIMSVIYISAIYGIRMVIRSYETEGRYERQRKSSKLISKALIVLQICRQLLHLIFYTILSIKILGEAQVPFMEGSSTNSLWNIFVVLPLILVALYGANRNVEKMARLYEMLFWVIFIPFVIMILFGLKEVDYSIFIPKLDMPVVKLLVYAYALVSFVVPVEQYLYLSPNVKDEKNTSYGALIGTIGLTIVCSLFILGIYGINGGAGEQMVTVDIMRYIRLPLGVLERFDVLMVWFFMLGCFILICSSLFYAGHLVTKLNVEKRIWWLLGIIIIGLILVYLLPNYRESLWLYLYYGALINLPLSLIVPLIGTVISEE